MKAFINIFIATAQTKGLAKALVMTNTTTTTATTYTSTKPKTTLSPTTLSTTTTQVICEDYQFKCYKSNSCIHKSWICDSEPDCPNEEDELTETCSATVCTCLLYTSPSPRDRG